MMATRICRLGCALLILGMAAASAQEREVEPLPSLAPLVEKVAPAVVNISVTEVVEPRTPLSRGRGLPPFLDEFLEEQPPERQGAGSGVIVDAEEGYVLTNHHVIETASEILVTLTDNRSFNAAVIGSDPDTDLAVLKIDGHDLTAIPIAMAEHLKVGDYVVAIGNPFGIGQTVTSGIVSALGRTGGFTENGYEDFIQTDASINPGNSGGALINLQGELVGINSAIISGFGGGNVGIGFAIPSEMLVSVMDRLLEFGEVRRGLLGVRMYSVTPAFADDYGLSVDSGALVSEVTSDSAAEAAGIRINDVIVGVDGENVINGNELRNKVAMKLPGEAVDLTIVRDGRERSIGAVLGERPKTLRDPAPRPETRSTQQSALEGVELMAEDGREPGLRVVSIAGGSVASMTQLQTGDLITAVNQRDVASVADAMRLAQATRTVVVEVERESRTQLIQLR
jgi:Do/DeqQ family serine protease